MVDGAPERVVGRDCVGIAMGERTDTRSAMLAMSIVSGSLPCPGITGTFLPIKGIWPAVAKSRWRNNPH